MQEDRQPVEARRRWMGRLAAVFFLAGGVLGIATVPLSPPDAHVAATVVVSSLAIVAGGVVWAIKWDRLPRAASLVLVPAGFALIAFGNLFGGSEYYTYGIFFVVAFVWIGLAHPPWTSLLCCPLAAVAYVVPILFLPGNVGAGLGSAAVTLPICVIVGESLARGIDRVSKTEVALQRQRAVSERLRALDAMRSEFLSTVSHELRTPITISRGHLEVLGDRPEPEELRRAVDLVIDELARMGRLVEDMGTLSSIGDATSLRTEDVSVNELLDSVSAKAMPFLDGRLRVLPVATDARVRADRQRLTQALLNLLQNAVVHGGETEPVEVRLFREPNGWLFEVIDHGPGLGAGDPQELFEPFRSGARSPGSGIGLAVVRRIAQAHGGSAGARDRGDGSTFWIRIPR